MKPSTLPRVSHHAVEIFGAYSRRFIRRRFHAIRVLRNGQPPRDLSRPLVIYLNHAAWWDPLVCLSLSRKWFAERTSYAPIDAAALERYRIFKHIGMYGVEQDSIRGARAFLRTTGAILSTERTVVWLTPQGRFTDARERPLQLRSGLGALAARLPDVDFLPLAIEYPFWTEPRPEILVSFGNAIVPRRAVPRSADEWTRVFAAALQETQDNLANRSCQRLPADWLTLERGARGVSAIYDTWRMLRARLTGAAFAREHLPEECTESSPS